MKQARILLVEDDFDFGNSFALILKRKGYDVTLTSSAKDALRLLRLDTYDLVISDVVMPNMSGLEFLRDFTESGILTPVIMLTGYGSVKEAVEAMKNGAYSYFLKPVNQDEVCLTIEKALEHARLRQENEFLKEEIYLLKGKMFPSHNDAVKQLIAQTYTLAQSDVNVLFTGESGTGKEVFARFIHESSRRRDKPFVPINCQAYPESLIESELFGYKPNSFTGASAKGKMGKLELVNCGTLFLDEIGDLALAAQVKLLRVLDSREIEPIGSVKPVSVNFRLITATNKILSEEIARKLFREDLYYRINTVTLKLPALRDRPEDIIPFARNFLQVFMSEQKKTALKFTQAAERALLNYPWPGNIRELRNCIEGAVALANKACIDVPELRLGNQAVTFKTNYCQTYRDARKTFERSFFLHYYKQCSGNISALSRLIGIDRKYLYKKLAFYNIIDISVKE